MSRFFISGYRHIVQYLLIKWRWSSDTDGEHTSIILVTGGDMRSADTSSCRFRCAEFLESMSQIKLLRSAHLCWPDTMQAAGVGTALRCWPLKLSPHRCRCRRHRLKKENVEWAKYRSNNACVGVLEGAAVPYHRVAVYPGLSNDRPWDNYRRSALFGERMACWPIMCVWSLPASNACVRCAFVHGIVRSLGDAISQGQRIHNRCRDMAESIWTLESIYFHSAPCTNSTTTQSTLPSLLSASNAFTFRLSGVAAASLQQCHSNQNIFKIILIINS